MTAPPAPFGRSAGSIANPSGTAAFLISIGTPQPVQVAIDTASGSLSDPQIAVLEASGKLVAANDDSTFSMDSFAGATMTPAAHWVLVREYGKGTGTFDLHVRPILFFSDTITNRTLNVNDEAGRLVLAFVALQALPAPQPLAPPIQGDLLIDLSVHIYLGFQLVPASGVTTCPLNFQPFQVVVQGVRYDAATGLFLMTELVR